MQPLQHLKQFLVLRGDLMGQIGDNELQALEVGDSPCVGGTPQDAATLELQDRWEGSDVTKVRRLSVGIGHSPITTCRVTTPNEKMSSFSS